MVLNCFPALSKPPTIVTIGSTLSVFVIIKEYSAIISRGFIKHLKMFPSGLAALIVCIYGEGNIG